MTVVLANLPEPQRQSWLGFLDVAAVIPHGWCIVSGQMVYLFREERGLSPTRATNDGDIVLDVPVDSGELEHPFRGLGTPRDRRVSEAA